MDHGSPGKGSEVGVAERRAEAVRLRSRGMSYREIGALLGVCGPTAYRYVRAGLDALHKELVAGTARLVAQEWDRLELPLPALQQRVLEGDLDAIDCWRKLSESRRKLRGLDEPDKHTLANPPGEAFKTFQGIDADKV